METYSAQSNYLLAEFSKWYFYLEFKTHCTNKNCLRVPNSLDSKVGFKTNQVVWSF